MADVTANAVAQNFEMLPEKFEKEVRKEIAKGSFLTKERLKKIGKKYEKNERKKIIEYTKYLSHLARISSKKMTPKTYISTPFPL